MILYEKLKKETGKEYAYRVLKDNIMCFQLKPGALLSESELAENLNLSRTPIREVLMKLKVEHLIEVKPQAGTYVSDIDWHVIKEAVFMRYTLEKEVLKEACIHFREDKLIEMEKCIFAQQLILDKKDNTLEFHHLDNEFHRLLFEGVGKSNIWDAISTISTHYNRMRLIAEMDKSKKNIVKQHVLYLNIIKDKNIKNIEKIINSHIKEPVREWEKIIKENKDIEVCIKNRG